MRGPRPWRSSAWSWRTWASATSRSLLPGMEPERARRGELAELVADHRLTHVDGYVLATVVHRERVTHHLGGDHRAPRPRLDDLAVTRVVHSLDLHPQVLVD